MNNNKCQFCGGLISEHLDNKECPDYDAVYGRTLEVVNQYASTCDGCGELTMHEAMKMDEKTQLGYCEKCMEYKNNLVKKHLEGLNLISPDQFVDTIFIDDDKYDKWEVYRISDDALFFVYFELTGNIGYAFCVKIKCKKMSYDFEAFYHVKSHSNEIKEDWDCGQDISDRLMAIAIAILKPY